MKPAPFAYHAPSSAEEALALLSEHGWDAKLLAGGQSLVPAMNFRLAQPAVLIDLNRIDELDYIRDDGNLRIGAMTRQAAVERSPLVARRAPLLAAAMPHIAHPQIRNRGTIGGSLAHADPAAELPAVALALGAELRARGPGGERRVAAADFFEGLFTTALGPDELLVEIAVPPLPAGSGWAFREVARRHGDYALVGVAVTLTLDGDGTCDAARVVLFSVGARPAIAAAAEALLRGTRLDPECIAAAARAAAHEDIDPPSDIHAGAAFRRHLAEVVTRRALQEALCRARGEAA